MRRLRLHLNGRPAVGLLDSLTGRAPSAAWDADGLKVDFFLANLENTAAEFDFATIAALTLEIRATPTSAALLAGPVAIDAALSACTYAAWYAGTDKHGSFTLTGAQMNFANGTTRVWMSIRATITGGQPVTFGAGWVTIIESRHGDSADPAANSGSGFLYVTSATPDPVTGEYPVSFRGKTGSIAINNVIP